MARPPSSSCSGSKSSVGRRRKRRAPREGANELQEPQAAPPRLAPRARPASDGGDSAPRSEEPLAGRDPGRRLRAGGSQDRAEDPERAAMGGAAGGRVIQRALSPSLRFGSDWLPDARFRRNDRRGQPIHLPDPEDSAPAPHREKAFDVRRSSLPGSLAPGAAGSDRGSRA